ncbi:Pimeloyl-ACP methyl ester carboxylesterase [Faunimonas pinastri]|uniref:Pimeloyl-ACP methyl ester carboxylesterase n=1 Tax=Faunimonas pinastri TaxID=1855383 RepID=A0A1H9KVS6_9HYPH|nr:alpha/beta hydrolase [Faunimonas pinastri]SER03139.1 Pimeloyl-ACP methyl ester carboxylesterase [Faunimonas pinastri]
MTHQDLREGRIIRFRAQDDLQLAARIFEAPDSLELPVICLPGFARNSRDFIRLGQFLSQDANRPRTVLAVDYRGRGLSAYDRNWKNYTPLVEAQDVMALATSLGIERASFVGTSRGGVIAMLLGVLRPGLIAGAALNDVGPVTSGTGLARMKRYLRSARPASNWDEAIVLVHRMLGSGFTALDDDDWRSLAEAVFRDMDGSLQPDYDPNLLRTLEELGYEAAIPVLWPQFSTLRRVPVLSIRGESSDWLSEDTVALMSEGHPDLTAVTVTGQGHAPLLRDAVTLQTISSFLERCR